VVAAHPGLLAFGYLRRPKEALGNVKDAAGKAKETVKDALRRD
jgi:hypothetical protein